MLYNPEKYDNNIITSRVRLARNLMEYPFSIENEKDAKSVIIGVAEILQKVDNFNLFYLANMTEMQLEAFKERHYLSQNLIDNKAKSAALINDDETISIMLHEEDILREQCFMRGLRLADAYKKLRTIDEALSKKLNFAYDKKLGYLTRCPSNVGTGLRASVMLFLPALTSNGKIVDVIKKVEELGLTARGIYGEGSSADGYMYQISNEVTLGVTENEIISGVEETVLTICEAEKIAEADLYKKVGTREMCLEAYKNLSSKKSLSYDEFMKDITKIKLGVSLKFFNFENAQAIDDLIVAVRPMNLCYYYSRDLTANERNTLRSEFVKKSLIKIKGASK